MDAILNELQAVDLLTLTKSALFFICGFLGMVGAYSYRWARDRVPVNLWCYLIGDRHEAGMAIAKLAGMCWFTGSFDYLQPMAINEVINAGVLLGMLIPNKVDEDKAKNKQAVKDYKANPVKVHTEPAP